MWGQFVQHRNFFPETFGKDHDFKNGWLCHVMLFLAFSNTQGLICRDRNKCICKGMIMKCQEVPLIPISEKIDMELNLRNALISDDDLDKLTGFKMVRIIRIT